MSHSSDPVAQIPVNDPEIEQAAVRARKTFRYFWRELAWERRRIIPGLDVAAVKGYFTDPPPKGSVETAPLEGEHMWLMNVDFDGQEISGVLINSPRSLQSLSEGDQVTIRGKQLMDWLYVQAGQVCGGFSVDVVRSRMSAGERKRHDSAWGFDFGDVGIVDLVPPSYLGEPERKRGGILSAFKKPKATPQDYGKVAQIEHPMSINMRDSLDAQLSQQPEFLTETDEHGFTLLHQLCLAGSFEGVDVCLKHGADPARPSAGGLTPLHLAKCLGWTRVVKRLEQAGAGR
ncbi:MAG: DUF2314 domain-containing protein [Planctomycetales bacterium]|nr:DUF2314 domain-containing protein [Planctomycetales bacterium]